MSYGTMKPTAVYRLASDGLSYASAYNLYLQVSDAAENAFFDSEIAEETDIQGIWRNVYRDLYREIRASSPELLRETGLLSPATQITTFHDGFPRAYATYPCLYICNDTPFATPNILLFSPVDYKGEHFVPIDSQRLEADNLKSTDLAPLFKGIAIPSLVFPMAPKGVALPDDFKPHEHASLNGSDHLGRTKACFIAMGRSKECIEDYTRIKNEWTETCAEVWKEIESLIAAAFDSPDTFTGNESAYLCISNTYGGELGKKTLFSLSVRQYGTPNELHDGQALRLHDNPYFLATEELKGEYVISPNPATEEGYLLKKLMDSVPPVPSIADYPELRGNFRLTLDEIDRKRGIDGVFPKVTQLMYTDILVYDHDVESRSNFCPADARPLNTALYRWLEQDQSDRRAGIIPPPRPAELQRIFAEQMGRRNSTSPPTLPRSPRFPTDPPRLDL